MARQTEKTIDTVIIGAGAAGLTAARDLTRAGKRVAILEARDRIGGRIHTIRDTNLPFPLELGAEFIHGKPPELLQIVESANLIKYDAEGEHWHFHDGRLEKRDDLWPAVEKIMGQLKDLRDKDISFAQFLEKYRKKDSTHRQQEMARLFVEGFEAAPADRISVSALAKAQKSADEAGGYQSMRLIDGYDRVIEQLRHAIDPTLASIHIRSIVTAVHWRAGHVEVHSSSPGGEAREIVRARSAIVTLPVGVLKAEPGSTGAVRFEPAIKNTRSAGRLEMGNVVKMIVKFRSAFWETTRLPTLAGKDSLEQMAYLHSARAPFATWWNFFPVRSTVLVGWAGGPSSDSLIGKTDQQIFQTGLHTLSRMLGLPGKQIEAQVEKFWVCDWPSDPFARGAYSYVPVGAVDAVRALGKPVKETLFFAGEATDAESFGGTVDSAITTGRRAARQVLRALTSGRLPL